MGKRLVRTEGERRVMAMGSVRRSTAPTIAQEAARVLPPLVDEAEELLSEIAEGRDGERRVRKLRRAVRRAAIMAGTLGCGYDAERVARLMKALRRVTKKAGEVRDMDVALRVIQGLGAGGDERAPCEVEREIAARRARAMKKLRVLGEEKSGVLRGRLAEMLGVVGWMRGDLPARCATAVALARVAEAMTMAAGAGLGTTALLHDLRLNLKEARMVLELMAPVVGNEAPGLAARAKELSRVLGGANDLAVVSVLLEGMNEKGSTKRRERARMIGASASTAHQKAHRIGVEKAKREAPKLAAEIRAVVFGGE